MADAPTAATQFFGKQLVSESGDVFIFNADGTVGGNLRGEAINGTFSASATEVCSEYTSPEFLVGQEYCSTPVVTDGSVVFNRRDGSQSQAYSIEG